MSSFLENEAKGDWRNFKGDHYHLIYLVWSLLHQSGAVAFYQGNDLLRIPSTVGTDDAAAPLQLQLQAGDGDEWVQLKAAEGVNWTCTAIIRDLLANFLYNALTSKENERDWKVILVTQSSIDRIKIENFVNEYSVADPDVGLKKDFLAVLNEIFRIWNSENQSQVLLADLESLGLEILRQISRQAPNLLEIMKLECKLKLMPLYPNEQRVERILNVLSGALLEEARKGPKHARYYDLSWLEQASGESLRANALFEKDPAGACEQASGSFLPRDWDYSYFTPRTALETALGEFLVATESVFCLIGSSGIGKSWTTAWVATQCQGHVPLLLAASELDAHKTVADLVASRLKVYTSVQESEEALLNRWRASATSPKTPVLILDDLRVSSADARQLRDRIASLCDQARRHGVKLILTCQAQIWRINNLGDKINPADVFPLSTEQDDFILSPETETPEDDTEVAADDTKDIFSTRHRAELRRSLKSQRVSFLTLDSNQPSTIGAHAFGGETFRTGIRETNRWWKFVTGRTAP